RVAGDRVRGRRPGPAAVPSRRSGPPCRPIPAVDSGVPGVRLGGRPRLRIPRTETRPAVGSGGVGPGTDRRPRDRGPPRAEPRRSRRGPLPAVFRSLRHPESAPRVARSARFGGAAAVRGLSGDLPPWPSGWATPTSLLLLVTSAVLATAMAAPLAAHLGRGVARRWSSSNPRRIAALSLLAVLILLAIATG